MTVNTQGSGLGGFGTLGAAACVACCAGPVLGFLAAIGVGTALGVIALGAAGLAIAILAIVPITRRRRADPCAVDEAPTLVTLGRDPE